MGCWQLYIINCLCFFKALEEQVSQEESSSQALREEVLAKEQNVLELRTAMKEVRLNPALQIHSCFFVSPPKKTKQNKNPPKLKDV